MNKKTLITLIFGITLGSVIGYFVGWQNHKNEQPYQPIEEAKICYYNLNEHGDTMQPQLREFLKARLYSVAANHIQEGWLDGWKIDFGPVDDSSLSPIYSIKNASSTESVYQSALHKHPNSAKKP